MRDIKFRGKRKDNGNWEYGNLIEHYDIFDRTKKYYYIESFTGEDRNQVLPETIGQYTGLKDKNGRAIYEGDMLKIFNIIGGDMFEWYVVYNENEGCFELRIEDDDEEVLSYPRKRLEVIGNIHEVRK